MEDHLLKAAYTLGTPDIQVALQEQEALRNALTKLVLVQAGGQTRTELSVRRLICLAWQNLQCSHK